MAKMNKKIINKKAKEPSQGETKKLTSELRIDNLVDEVTYAQDIIDTVREPFIVLDGTFHVVTANVAFYRLFKDTKKNTEGTLIYKLGNNQWNIPELRKLLEDVLPKKKAFYDYEVHHVFPSIGQKIMLLNARRIDHKQLILLAIADITKEKELELLHERGEKRFRALIEKSADAIALVNPDGKVAYASPSTKSVTGYSVEEFQKLSNPFELAPPDDRKLVTQLFEQVLKKPGNNAEAVYRIKHKNGYHIWIESIMTNLTSDPNVHAVVLNYRDVTKRKELETQKDDFIGIASHELKTPVTSIKAYTQLLQRQFKQFGNEKATQNLAKMDAQLNKLNALISDLLDVTKIDSGKIVFNKDLFDFDKLIADTIDQMQLISEQHNITLKGTVKKDVFADRERIGLVLTNLLTNAVKYSPHGDNVTVHVSKDGKDVVVGVQDLGIGIPKKNLSKVFERFFRVKSPKGDTYPGLGLGLYISAEIIKRHEGKMWVDSEHNRGSTFYFSIPIIGKRETNKLKTEDVEEEMKHE